MKAMFLQELTGGLFGGLLGRLSKLGLKGLLAKTPVLAVLFLTAIITACASGDSKSSNPPPKADCTFVEDASTKNCGLIVLTPFDSITNYTITVGEVGKVNTTKIVLDNFRFTQIIQGSTSNQPVVFDQDQKLLTLEANATALNLTIIDIDDDVFGNFYIELVKSDDASVKIRYTISITAVNDAPVFEAGVGSGQFANATGATPANYTFTDIPFNSTDGYSVGNVSASDVDSDTVSYNIDDKYSINGSTSKVENTLFQINQDTGEITLKAIVDADSAGEYTFNVTASDNEGGDVMAEITVSVPSAGGTPPPPIPPANCVFAEDVGNTTDCEILALPQFFDSNTTYNITVGEVLAGQEVNTNKIGLSNFTFTQIINGDISDPLSGTVFPSGNQLTLSANATALNITISDIASNVFGEFYIELVKSDDDTVKIRYTISITAVNDDPVFSAVRGSEDQFTPAAGSTPARYRFADIPFNSTIGYSMGNVSASDAENNTITYSIEYESIYPLFLINPMTGEITLRALADAEALYTFNVIATDDKGGSATATISVEVLPNQAPMFVAVSGSESQFTAANVTTATPASYNFTGIPRNSLINRLVGNVSTTDPDGGAPMYNISDEYNINGSTTASNNDLFQINSTGGITLIRGAIDNDLGGYTFNVTASDGQGGTTTATISVEVLPNEAPKFIAITGLSSQFTPADGATPANYIFADLHIASPVGSSVGNVSATDANNDAISYNISAKSIRTGDNAQDNELFNINSTTGEITLLGVVGFAGEYHVNATATDDQGESTEATIFVNIYDITPPAFTRTSYNFDLSLSMAIDGAVVGNVSAMDAEETDFGYSLEGGGDLFEFADADNPEDGTRNIILGRAATLSDFAEPYVTFQVMAEHIVGGISSMAKVTVNLINDDDSDGDGIKGFYDADPIDVIMQVTGNGEPNDPYIISNIYQLQAIAGVDHTGTALDSSTFTNNRFLYGTDAADQLTKHYMLANDINASATNAAVWDKLAVDADNFVGRGWTPIAGNSDQSFSGSFNGEGYTISNLNMTLRIPTGTFNTAGTFGLFGTNRGNISAIGMENIEMRIQYRGDNLEFPDDGSGGLVGQNERGGIIQYSYVSGLVNATAHNVGGLVGHNLGEISYSYSTATAEGRLYTGGLVGANSGGGRILSSYATGNVNGGYGVGDGRPSNIDSLVGALVGYIDGNVGNILNATYATGVPAEKGSSAAASYLGSFVGQLLIPGVTITSSYWFNNTAIAEITAIGSGESVAGHTGLSNAQLQGCQLDGAAIAGVDPAPDCTDLFPAGDWGNTTDSSAGTFDIERGWVFRANEYPSLSAVRSSDNRQLLPSAAQQECQRNDMPLDCE